MDLTYIPPFPMPEWVILCDGPISPEDQAKRTELQDGLRKDNIVYGVGVLPHGWYFHIESGLVLKDGWGVCKTNA